MRKRFLAIVLAMLMLFASFGAAFAAVVGGHWAESALRHFENAGVLTSGSYDPDAPATRELVAIMIDSELGNPAISNQIFFSDTASSSHSIQIGVVASILGLAGYPDGTFRPQNPITRGEVATMLGNKNSLTQVNSTLSFKDTIPAWCLNGVSKAFKVGLIVGYPDGTFRAAQSITIAEAATIISKWRLLINQGVINAPLIPDPPAQLPSIPNPNSGTIPSIPNPPAQNVSIPDPDSGVPSIPTPPAQNVSIPDPYSGAPVIPAPPAQNFYSIPDPDNNNSGTPSIPAPPASYSSSNLMVIPEPDGNSGVPAIPAPPAIPNPPTV